MSASHRVLHQSKDIPLRNNFLNGVQLHPVDGIAVVVGAKSVELCKCSIRSLEFTNSVKIPLETSSSIKDYKWMLQTGSKKCIAILLEKELAIYSIDDGSSKLLHSISFDKGFVPLRIVPLSCALISLVVLGNEAPLRVTISSRGSSPVKIESLIPSFDGSGSAKLLEPRGNIFPSKCSLASVSAYGVLFTCAGAMSTLRAVVNPQDSKRLKIVTPSSCEAACSNKSVSSLACFGSYVIMCCSGVNKAEPSITVRPVVSSSTSLLDSITSSTSTTSSSFKHVLPGTSILEALSVDDAATRHTLDAAVLENALNAKRVNKSSSIMIVDPSSSGAAVNQSGNNDATSSSGILDKLMDIGGMVASSSQGAIKSSIISATNRGRSEEDGGSLIIYLLGEAEDGEHHLFRVTDASLQDTLLSCPDLCCVHSISDTTALLAVGSCTNNRVALYAIQLSRDVSVASLQSGSGAGSGAEVKKLSVIDLPEKHICRGLQFVTDNPSGASQTGPVSLIVMASKKTQTTAPLTSLSTSSLQSYQLLSYDVSDHCRSVVNTNSSASLATVTATKRPPNNVTNTSNEIVDSAPASSSSDGMSGIPDYAVVILSAISALHANMEKRLDAIDVRLDDQKKSIDELARIVGQR